MAEPHNPATAEADADAKAYVHGHMARCNEQISTYRSVPDPGQMGFSLAIAVLLVFLTSCGSIRAAVSWSALIAAVVLGGGGLRGLEIQAPEPLILPNSAQDRL